MTGAALTPAVAAMLLFGTFFALMVLRVPVAFALGLACLPVLFIEPRLSPMVVFNTTFKAYNSFILLAVPFFLLTANLMNVGGITDRLVTLSRTMVGNFPGALAQINVLLSVFFAGISGSSTADAASQGKIFIEAQVKEGYDLSFSIAITAVSAVLAVIIPPSILMVVWGGVLSVSIGALYLAGVIPGLLIGLAQMATVHVYAKIRHYPTYPRATLKEFFTAAAVVGPGADDAVHHRRRHPARLVHRDRVRGRGGDLRRRAVALLLPRNGPAPAVARAARNRKALGDRAVLRRHGVGVRLAARLLPDPEGAARERHVVGPGPHRRRLLHRVRVPRRRLLPRRDPGDHHRRHHAAAAGRVGATCIRCRSRSSASSRSRSGWSRRRTACA